MAFLVQRSWTRPNTGIKFFSEAHPTAANNAQSIINTYKTNGKLLSESYSRSSDNLTSSYSALWVSEAEWNAYKGNQSMISYWDSRSSYNAQNGITSTPTNTTTV